MRKDFYYESSCGGMIHACSWAPEGEIRAVVQLVHGIAEHVYRYDHFAAFLNSLGYLVVAEDHMGHGGSVCKESPKGCFPGGWMHAIADSYRLLTDTKKAYPDVPYVLFGHSMGSFMARTILAEHPDSGITAAIICGTGWQPEAVVGAGYALSTLICNLKGEDKPSPMLQAMAFGGFNKRIAHPRTQSDWLSRDEKVVDLYESDPLCGFMPSAGLLRAMMFGIRYIQKADSLKRMRKELPVLFIAGGDDPVGAYGVGVRQAAEAFKSHGMQDVSVKLYPLCRHEILNEINKEEIYQDIADWIASKI